MAPLFHRDEKTIAPRSQAGLALVAVIAIACAGGSGGGGGGGGGAMLRGAPASRIAPGTYDYVANLPGIQIQGMVAIIQDTIIVRPSQGECTPVMGVPSSEVIRYECFNVGRFERVVLQLDRRNVIQWSKWYSIEKVQKQRRVCSQTVTNASGVRTCSRFTMEYYEEPVSRSGVITLRPTS